MAVITALYPARFACEDKTSIDCALEILGISSIEKTDIDLFLIPSSFDMLSNGFKSPTKQELFFNLDKISSEGRSIDRRTSVFPTISSRDKICAPTFLYRSSWKKLSEPALDSIKTV